MYLKGATMILMEFTTDYGTKVMINFNNIAAITEGVIDSEYTQIRLVSNYVILVKENYVDLKYILRQYIPYTEGGKIDTSKTHLFGLPIFGY